jgi:triacylglycerol lipase
LYSFVKRWRTVLLGLLLCARSSSALARDGLSQNHRGDYVVLLHGLGRTAWSMKPLQWALARQGYHVVNVAYSSTRVSIEEAAGDWLARLLGVRATDRTVKIHFVTHSLGGIVLRQYLLQHQIENLGRVVMLAPPNSGSELVDRLRHNPLYKHLTGPAGQELGTERGSLPNRLGPVDFEVGIIAGDRSLNPFFSTWIPGPDDGKVSVQRTQVEAMKDFLVVHHSHTWMMWRRSVLCSVSRFLSQGSFQDGEDFFQAAN